MAIVIFHPIGDKDTLSFLVIVVRKRMESSNLNNAKLEEMVTPSNPTAKGMSTMIITGWTW